MKQSTSCSSKRYTKRCSFWRKVSSWRPSTLPASPISSTPWASKSTTTACPTPAAWCHRPSVSERKERNYSPALPIKTICAAMPNSPIRRTYYKSKGAIISWTPPPSHYKKEEHSIPCPCMKTKKTRPSNQQRRSEGLPFKKAIAWTSQRIQTED